MGLGRYLASRRHAEHYASEREREEQEVAQVPEQERGEVIELFRSYGLTEEHAPPVVRV